MYDYLSMHAIGYLYWYVLGQSTSSLSIPQHFNCKYTSADIASCNDEITFDSSILWFAICLENIIHMSV